MNKKAMAFAAILSIFISIVFFILFAELNQMFSTADGGGKDPVYLGSTSIGIQSAKIPIQKTTLLHKSAIDRILRIGMKDLAKSGMTPKSSCGIYKGFSIWQDGRKKCYPTLSSASNVILEKSKQAINSIASPVPYELTVIDKDGKYYVGAIALAPQQVPIECGCKGKIRPTGMVALDPRKQTCESKTCGTYVEYPSFSVPIEYDTAKIAKLSAHAQVMVQECSKSKDPKLCVEEKSKELNWKLDCSGQDSGDMHTFCVGEEIEYRFALRVSEPVPLRILTLTINGQPESKDPYQPISLSTLDNLLIEAELESESKIESFICIVKNQNEECKTLTYKKQNGVYYINGEINNLDLPLKSYLKIVNEENTVKSAEAEILPMILTVGNDDINAPLH